jgi:2-polyprenyl-3-methyl-5-hydroxy-6-metoxy-1,4-benzoquinol methylase
LSGSTAKTQKAIYDGEHEGYVPLYADLAAFKALMRAQVERARLSGRFGTSLKAVRNAKELSRLGLRPGQRVLDCGSGGGILINQLVARFGVKGAGVDLSRLALSRAREAGSKAIIYKQGVLEKLPFATGSFDAVVSFDVLEHVEPKAQALAEIVRVLKPGGKALVYAVSSADSLTWHWCLRALTLGRWGQDDEAGHSPELMASPKRTRAQFEAAGARVLRLSYLHSFFTLIVDEALGFLRARQRQPHAAGAEAPAARGSRDRAYALLAILEPVLDLLEWPWKAFGLSNGFFILVEKN